MSTTPPVLAAELAGAWADIQRHHSELPDLAAPESLIGESSSACGHELSFERLLHEAVHGIAAARGVRDTSRAGRYHNRRFLAIAEELGLDHPEEPHPSSGFSLVTLNPEAKRRYRPTIERLQRALKAHTAATAADTARSFRGPAARHGSSGGGVRVKAVCDCGRNVRVVPSVLAQAPIVCGGAASPSGFRRWSARQPADPGATPASRGCRQHTPAGSRASRSVAGRCGISGGTPARG